MKPFLLCLVFTIGLDQPLIVTKNGIGEISIGASTYQDVKQIFKNGSRQKRKKIIQQISMLTTDHRCIVQKKIIPKATIYKSENDGYEFTFHEKKLSQIAIWTPMKATTDSGITLGKSTFKELETEYGRSISFPYEKRIAKRYGNLIFLSKENFSTTLEDSLKIDKIVIYKE